MNRSRAYIRLAVVFGLVTALAIASLVLAQSQTKTGETGTEGNQPGAMVSQGQQQMEGMQKGMQSWPMDAGKMMEQRISMMEKAGIPKEQIEQWKSRMSVKVRPDSPAGLIGFKDTLNLTPDQIDRLQSLEDETARKAFDLLTDAQKATFNKVKYDPGTVMEMTMHIGRQAMSRMHEGSMGQQMMNEGSGMKEGMGMMGGMKTPEK